MDWRNSKSVETRIRRLERELAEIDRFFYFAGKNDDDKVLYAGMLERKRDDMVRSTVLQLHTGIEDLLDHLIIFHILDTDITNRSRRLSTKRGRALRKMLYGAPIAPLRSISGTARQWLPSLRE